MFAQLRAQRVHGAEHFQRGQRLRGVGCPRRGTLDQRMQPLDPRFHRLLRPLRIVVERAERLVVHRRILAQVERGQVEAEAARAPEHAAQREAAGVFAAVAGQAGIDGFQVANELVGIGVALTTVVRGRRQPRAHQVQQLPVGHVRQPRLVFHRAGQQRAMGLGAPRDLRIPRHPRLALGQDVAERAQVGAIAGQRGGALHLQRVADGGGADVGIAVHVAAHPGAEAQQRGQFDPLAVHRLDRVGEGFVEHRQHPEQHAAQVEADVLDLVRHGRLLRRRLVGLPGGGQRLADARLVRALLRRRAGAVDVGHQPLDDSALLEQQRAPHRFRRMRREHRLDAHAPEQVAQLFEGDAIGVQRAQHRLDAARLRCGPGALVVAAAADAVHAFGQVDRAEPGGERAHQRLGVLQRHAGQALGQRIDRLVVFAPRDRGLAHRFDQVEQFRRHLLRQHLPDHRAQAAHVVAQQGVGFGEVEAIAVGGRCGSGLCGHSRRLARFLPHCSKEAKSKAGTLIRSDKGGSKGERAQVQTSLGAPSRIARPATLQGDLSILRVGPNNCRHPREGGDPWT